MSNQIIETKKTNNQMLTDTIEKCFRLSIDARLSSEQQSNFYNTGQQLSDRLLDLIKAEFESATQELKDANAEIQKCNTAIKAMSSNLDDINNTMKLVANLVGVLDQLLALAVKLFP